MKYVFQYFRASDKPLECENFIRGHVEVLKDFGITNVTTNNNSWINNPNIHVLVVKPFGSDDLLGGIRIHELVDNELLPIEHALNDLDEKVGPYIRSVNHPRTAEICGLWNSKRVFGKGLSHVLSRTAVAISTKLEIQKLFCLTAPYTKITAESIGFRTVISLGENGEFNYPIETHRATIMEIGDTSILSSASGVEREKIELIRSHPSLEITENSIRGKIEILYNLFNQLA